jgi:heptosyltransferase I
MKPSLPLAQPPKSICILRLSAIGDCTHVVPMVRTIQKHWPGAGITWIIGTLEASLVGDIEGVEFIVFDKSRRLRALVDLRRALAGRSFDVLLNLQVALRASIVSLFVKAPVRLGYDRERARDAQRFFTTHRVAAVERQHVLDSFFEFTRALGLAERELEWNLPIPSAAREFAASIFDSGREVLAINASASKAIRNWSVEGYAAVADHAAAKLGLDVVLTGGPSAAEARLAEAIEKAADSRLLNLVGKTNLKELLAVIERASVILAPDTGPAHMGTTVGTPVIGLYAASNPLRSGPYLSLEHTVNNYAEALQAECGARVDEVRWGTRVRAAAAMETITVEQVIEKLDPIFS